MELQNVSDPRREEEEHLDEIGFRSTLLWYADRPARGRSECYVNFHKLYRHLGSIHPQYMKIHRNYTPSDDEIDKRGKANVLSKSVTRNQIFWVSVQVSGRLIEGITVSLPEVVTICFTILTLVSLYLSLVPT